MANSKRENWAVWVQEQRAADLAMWQSIEEKGNQLIEYAGSALHQDTVRQLAKELLDAEYNLTADCEVTSKLCDALGIDTEGLDGSSDGLEDDDADN